MALVFSFSPTPAMTAGTYDQAIRRLEQAGAANPPGRLYHVCYGDPANVRVLDIWESREDFDRFGRTLGPILQELGVGPGEPEITEVHNVVDGAAAAARGTGHVDKHRAAHAAF